MQESAFLTNSEVVSCHIDLGRELSIMHGILKEHIHKLSNVRSSLADAIYSVCYCSTLLGCFSSFTKFG